MLPGSIVNVARAETGRKSPLSGARPEPENSTLVPVKTTLAASSGRDEANRLVTAKPSQSRTSGAECRRCYTTKLRGRRMATASRPQHAPTGLSARRGQSARRKQVADGSSARRLFPSRSLTDHWPRTSGRAPGKWPTGQFPAWIRPAHAAAAKPRFFGRPDRPPLGIERRPSWQASLRSTRASC